jgi:hypothetical protein
MFTISLYDTPTVPFNASAPTIVEAVGQIQHYQSVAQHHGWAEARIVVQPSGALPQCTYTVNELVNLDVFERKLTTAVFQSPIVQHAIHLIIGVSDD